MEKLEQIICHVCNEAIPYNEIRYTTALVVHEKCRTLITKGDLIKRDLLRMYSGRSEALNPFHPKNMVDETMRVYRIPREFAVMLHNEVMAEYKGTFAYIDEQNNRLQTLRTCFEGLMIKPEFNLKKFLTRKTKVI